MQERLLRFIASLRQGGLPVSIGETLDVSRAIGLVGVERHALRETLATCLVKDEADRPLFDAQFDQHFPLIGPSGRARRRRRVRAGGEGGIGHAGGGGRPGGPAARHGQRAPAGQPASAPRGPAPLDDAAKRVQRPQGDHSALGADTQPRRRWRHAKEGIHSSAPSKQDGLHPGTAHIRRDLLRKPFREHTPAEVEAVRDLVSILAREFRGRLGRRLRRRRRGRIDVRRTMRQATSSGGVPVRLAFRGPRPGRPNLVALCDVSGSVARVSEFLLGLIAPAAGFFRSVDTFVYVDHLHFASFEGGHLVHDTALDRYAFSDFGQVLAEYCAGPGIGVDRNTVLLVLGDARNNRRPSRATFLAGLRARAQAVFWLNPEPVDRWNTGDSVIGQYAPHCTAVLECSTLGALVDSLGRTLAGR